MNFGQTIGMRSALFWLSLPFVFPQALDVRRRALRFNGADGPREGIIGDGDVRRLLVFGDSIAAGVGASEFSRALVGQAALSLSEITEQRIHWSADGQIGANSDKLLHKLSKTAVDGPVDYIILSIGVNDVTSLATLRKWRSNLAELLRRLTDVYLEPAIAVAGLPPFSGFPLLPQPLRAVMGSRGIEFNRAAQDIVAAHSNATHVPIRFATTPERFAPDGFHPSEIGYSEYGEVMGEALARLDQKHTN